MSKVNTILNNLKHFPVDQETSICFGELSVNIEDLDTFQIDGNIKSDSHIILTNSQSDKIFKDILSEAPLIGDYSVTVYDYSSTITNKYLKERVTNNPGTVNNKLSKINLLSQIKLPDVNKNDEIYLVLDSYEALEMVLLDDSKIQLLNKDIQTFIEKNMIGRENVNLFITKEIYDSITKFVSIDILNFKKAWICNNCCMSNLVEYLMGKTLNFSNKSYQGHIELPKYFDILSVLISSKSTDSMIGRNNSVLQFNTFNGSTSFKFIIILKNSKELTNIDFNMGGKTLGSSKLLKKEDTNISFEYIKQFVDNYNFHNMINKIDSQKRKDFIVNNSQKVIEYFMLKLEDNLVYIGDDLELIHLSNINYLQVIKSLLMNECNNTYHNIRPFNNPETVTKRHIPIQRNNSVAYYNDSY